jgi:hypothetical protein
MQLVSQIQNNAFFRRIQNRKAAAPVRAESKIVLFSNTDEIRLLPNDSGQQQDIRRPSLPGKKPFFAVVSNQTPTHNPI